MLTEATAKDETV